MYFKIHCTRLFSVVIGFFIYALLQVFFLSSCGFLGPGAGRSFQEDSIASGAGDGDTPTLASRVRDNPDLEEQECRDNDRCEEACRDIYEDGDSYRDCYDLTIGQVSRMEDVFYSLLESDPDGLAEIDDDDLLFYLKVGLDGWRDRLIDRQTEKTDRDERFINTLEWIVDEENDLIPILEKRDQDNEILKRIFLESCHSDNDHQCANGIGMSVGVCELLDSGGSSISSPTTDANAILGVAGSTDDHDNLISLDYSTGDLYFCRKDSGQDPNVYQLYRSTIALIDAAEERRQLFVALMAGGGFFFSRAAENRRFDAFALGNDLLQKACASRNDVSFDQCVRAFYCHLLDYLSEGGTVTPSIDNDFLRNSSLVEKIGREIDLANCDFGNFNDLSN